MANTYYTYILVSQHDGTLYVGVTSNLIKRVQEHKSGLVDGCASQTDIHRLVYFEEHPDPNAAIRREMRLKDWKHDWKIALIEIDNPTWRDLYDDLL